MIIQYLENVFAAFKIGQCILQCGLTKQVKLTSTLHFALCFQLANYSKPQRLREKKSVRNSASHHITDYHYDLYYQRVKQPTGH